MSDSQEAFVSRAITGKKLLYLEGALGIVLGASFVIFGWYVLVIAAVSIALSVGVDFVFAKAKKQKIDESWLIFPLLYALMLPPSAPLWMAGVGVVFGNLFAKQLFGGYGRTIFHPAAVGIMFLMISFPALIFGWYDPEVFGWFNPFSQASLDALAPVMPLHQINAGGSSAWSLLDLALGSVPGNIGETFGLLLIALGTVLAVLKVIEWRLPVAIIVSYLITAGIFELFGATGGTIPSVFTGSLLFGAIFIASDPVHAPVNHKAIWIYGAGIAFITFIIRYFATFAEGFIFAVIIMSAVGALVDAWLTGKEETA
mgnify:CR=1 FL=1